MYLIKITLICTKKANFFYTTDIPSYVCFLCLVPLRYISSAAVAQRAHKNQIKRPEIKRLRCRDAPDDYYANLFCLSIQKSRKSYSRTAR